MSERAVSKVTLNGTTLIDVTQDTVTAETLLVGNTATAADGHRVSGIYAEKVIVSDSVPATYELDETDNMYIKHYS